MVRLRVGRIREVKKIPRIGRVIDCNLRRKKLHGGKSEDRTQELIHQ